MAVPIVVQSYKRNTSERALETLFKACADDRWDHVYLNSAQFGSRVRNKCPQNQIQSELFTRDRDIV